MRAYRILDVGAACAILVSMSVCAAAILTGEHSRLVQLKGGQCDCKTCSNTTKRIDSCHAGSGSWTECSRSECEVEHQWWAQCPTADPGAGCPMKADEEQYSYKDEWKDGQPSECATASGSMQTLSKADDCGKPGIERNCVISQRCEGTVLSTLYGSPRQVCDVEI
jgi:hypothetical protein